MVTLVFIAHILPKEHRKYLIEKLKIKPLLYRDHSELLPKWIPCCFLINSEEDSAMVFVSSEVGEHSITTRDLNVNENTIIQFEVLDFVLLVML